MSEHTHIHTNTHAHLPIDSLGDGQGNDEIFHDEEIGLENGNGLNESIR